MKKEIDQLTSLRCLYTRLLKEGRLQEEGKTEGGKEFHRLPVYGKKQAPYRSMRGLPTSTQNSCEAVASLVLRPQFLGPGTQ